MGDRRGACTILVGRPDGRDYLKDLGVDTTVIIKLTFRKWNGEAWTGLF
jgi:hypothetical protein